jgi:RND family efflux transporter MFP subunit
MAEWHTQGRLALSEAPSEELTELVVQVGRTVVTLDQAASEAEERGAREPGDRTSALSDDARQEVCPQTARGYENAYRLIERLGSEAIERLLEIFEQQRFGCPCADPDTEARRTPGAAGGRRAHESGSMLSREMKAPGRGARDKLAIASRGGGGRMTELQERLDTLKIDRDEEPEGQRPRWLLWLLPLVLLIAAAVAWTIRPQAIEVRTAAARLQQIGGQQTILNASGYVVARRQATVSSKVTGKVTEVLIEEGMLVEEGQVLARLDLSNTNVSLRLAEAQRDASGTALEETRVRLDEAELELRRAQELVEKGVSSQAELDSARAQRDSLEARLERQADEVAVAERQVAFWGQEVDDRVIRAPFAGVVVSKNAQPGEMISPVSAGGGFTRTGICTVVDMSSLEIEVDVNEAYINRVTPGQPVEAVLDAYPDWKIPARVIAIVPTADRQRATVRVRVGFETLDTRILPDMGVKVAFQEVAGNDAPRPSRVVVPASALTTDGDQDIVWVVSAGVIERRAVNVEEIRGAEAYVAAGLREGERVVLEGPEGLEEGDEVEEIS